MKTKAIPQPPASFSKQARKAIPTDNSFSDQKCGDTTQGFSCAADRRTDDKLNTILRKVQCAARELARAAGASGEEIDNEGSDDEYARICKHLHHFSERTDMVYSGFLLLVSPLPSPCHKSCF